MTPSVLSTKKLAPHQRELLLNAGIGLVEQNFISIVPLDFKGTELQENIIVTSQNTVELLLQKIPFAQLREKRFFCVGEKTSSLLRAKGLEVTKRADYGSELGKIISERYSQSGFTFFCGKKRRPELPGILREDLIQFNEVQLYDTELTPTKIDRNFKAILFFSPSAVESFCTVNDLSESTAFCIGTTTAAEARKFTSNIVLAAKPTIESVIVAVVKELAR